MPAKIEVANIPAREFRALLFANGACQDAMTWYRNQPRRDLRSILKALRRGGWLAWLLPNILDGHSLGILRSAVSYYPCACGACESAEKYAKFLKDAKAMITVVDKPR